MIELDKLLQLARNTGVSLDVMIMEAYQMLLLNDISESVISKNLILKGGTCLRLGYQAWRFSEDLDFSWLKKIEFSKFKQVITAIAKRYPEVVIDDIYDMKKTLFARLVVQIGKRRVGIKIEVSKRFEEWRRGEDYDYKMLKSPASPLQPYLKISTLKKIYADKLRMVEERKKPRDWFDLWFLSQKLDKKFGKKVGVSKKLMLDRVRFLLPKSKRFILNEFEYES